MMYTKDKKASITVRLTMEEYKRLKELSDITGIPTSEHIRQSIRNIFLKSPWSCKNI